MGFRVYTKRSTRKIKTKTGGTKTVTVKAHLNKRKPRKA